MGVAERGEQGLTAFTGRRSNRSRRRSRLASTRRHQSFRGKPPTARAQDQRESSLKHAASVPDEYDKSYYGSGFLDIVGAL